VLGDGDHLVILTVRVDQGASKRPTTSQPVRQ
jgi:hypothetical protein